nr:hypothetical protein [Candidatus Sigynarchaeum springense]
MADAEMPPGDAFLEKRPPREQARSRSRSRRYILPGRSRSPSAGDHHRGESPGPPYGITLDIATFRFTARRKHVEHTPRWILVSAC